MDTVVTLICNPAAPALDHGLVTRVSARLGGSGGAGPVRRTTLAEGVAEDFSFATTGDLAGVRADIEALLRDRPIDVAVQPAGARRKRLLIADMDSTIIGQECIDEIADFAGKRAEISAITERAMRGELDFEGALLERLAMLKGLSESVLEEAFRTRIRLNPGARTLVQTMKRQGAFTALVSGGFTFFTSRVAAAAGFDYHDSNILLVENGKLAGDVERPIRGRSAKEAALIRLSEENSIPLEATLAVGDGANDLAMLKRAGLGVAFHAKPAVAAAADISVRHGDLTALLYLQGIPHTEFID
ncbi:MAG: phosphoserine phosphatase SerB [Alphaproteobacteria bacterium]|nr:phosphoserine phosphatase SerB [Alphaproteobacteria bacterium]